MLDALQMLRHFLYLLAQTIGSAWSFRLAETLTMLSGEPLAPWIVAAVPVLAGASLLAGESIILFVNRVRRSRFLLSLLFNGVAFGIEMLIGALVIWGLGALLFTFDTPFIDVIRAVVLSSAPFVLAFLTFIPYLGTFIARVLYVWWFLILFRAVRVAFDVEILAAILCVGLAWLVILIFNRTLGRPVAGLRDRVWERVIGTRPGYVHASDLLDDATGAPAEATARIDNLLE